MYSITRFDLLLILLAGFFIYKLTQRRRLYSPPGPKGYPIIGNLFDIPKEFIWKTFAKWGEKYGGIVSVDVLGQTYVIVNDPKIAIDMLDRKGSLYSDRPTFPMADLCGWHRVLSQAQSSRARQYRKLIARVIGTQAKMTKFQPLADSQATMLLKRILANPEALEEGIRKTAGATVLDMTYGYKVKEEGKDPLVDLVKRALEQFSEITQPGAFLIDILPFLKYVPAWFPGAGFKRLAVRYKKDLDDFGDVPLAYVQEQIARGTATPSFTADLLKDKDISADDLYNIRWSAASFYGAGAESTAAIVQEYFLVAALYPEIQRRAQAEIDSVVESGHLPSFEHRASLPYIEAICKELYRWMPVVPLAVPHCTLVDDIHEGYHIPHGSWVFPNVWKFLHDSDTYRNPSKFNPDRFMGPNPEQNPADFCFGFGRRICPGIHMADISVWINVVKVAAALDVTKAVDAQGNVIEPIVGVTDGFISRPLPFKCNVKARSDDVSQLIKEAVEDQA